MTTSMACTKSLATARNFNIVDDDDNGNDNDNDFEDVGSSGFSFNCP